MLELSSVSMQKKPSLHPLDARLALPMYVATMAFLVCLAGALQFQDSDSQSSSSPDEIVQTQQVPSAELSDEPLPIDVRYQAIFAGCAWGMALLYPLFIGELILHLAMRSKFWKQHILFCLIPPLRLGARDHVTGRSVWFPRSGWSTVDRDLQPRMEKVFSRPMIAITLATLPLMAADYYWGEKISKIAGLDLVVQTTFALIWLSFAVEFIVMMSIVDRKIRYIKEHWIDLVVILLPLVAMLRFLRIARLGRLARLQQLTKTTRVFRMRGALMRTYRAILVLDVIDRIVRGKPEIRLSRLQEALAEKELELEEIRKEIQELQATLHGGSEPLSKAA